MAKRSLTGIQPTGAQHIGNLLGAIRPGIALQETHETFYFIASYHGLTSVKDAARLREYTLDAAAIWLAFGLDPDRTVFWAQQDVPEVCELAWILGCAASKGMLDKSHAFKDAVAQGKDVNVGLYTYPVLMAADILAFDANVVPVGKDQKQHLEMTRDMAQRINHIYGDTLVVPEPLITAEVASVPGLDGRKMSKSYNNTIELSLPTKKLRKKIMGIVTDSTPLEEPKDPEICNVFAFYKLFATADQRVELAQRYRAGGMGYGHAKQALFEVMEADLAAPRARYEELRSRPEHLREILAAGAVSARAIASETLTRVRDHVGL